MRWTRVTAVLFGGALAGLAGVHLALAHSGTFAEGMSAGRGVIAIAVVVLGRWNPLGVGLAALFFGAASAVQFFLQAVGLDVPYQLVLALPYVLTLLALAGLNKNSEIIAMRAAGMSLRRLIRCVALPAVLLVGSLYAVSVRFP